jgi:hypothetical protein
MTTEAENLVDRESQESLTLEINGEAVETKNVVLDRFETKSVIFEHSFEQSGEYEITVNGVETTDSSPVLVSDSSTNNQNTDSLDVELYSGILTGLAGATGIAYALKRRLE